MTERAAEHAAKLKALGTRVRSARGEMTQVALADATEINQSTLSKYERGEVEPGVLSLAEIARACSVSLEWLATGEVASETAMGTAHSLSPTRNERGGQ